ncbi:hypothetical protein KIL84_007178, partial [Mauremys mutica]
MERISASMRKQEDNERGLLLLPEVSGSKIGPSCSKLLHSATEVAASEVNTYCKRLGVSFMCLGATQTNPHLGRGGGEEISSRSRWSSATHVGEMEGLPLLSTG